MIDFFSLSIIILILLGLIDHYSHKHDQYKTRKMMSDYYCSDEYKKSQSEWAELLEIGSDQKKLKKFIIEKYQTGKDRNEL